MLGEITAKHFSLTESLKKKPPREAGIQKRMRDSEGGRDDDDDDDDDGGGGLAQGRTTTYSKIEKIKKYESKC